MWAIKPIWDGRACSIHAEGIRNRYRILKGKPEGKRSFWRSRRRIILKQVLKVQEECGLDSSGL
jgi:hypothetical protein